MNHADRHTAAQNKKAISVPKQYISKAYKGNGGKAPRVDPNSGRMFRFTLQRFASWGRTPLPTGCEPGLAPEPHWKWW